MLKILIIGTTAISRAQALQEQHVDMFSIETARLPAEGIRKLEQTPPDTLILIDELPEPRIRPVIDAIRDRPLGQIIPIIAICNANTTIEGVHIAQELGVERHLAPDAPVQALHHALRQMLGMPLENQETKDETPIEVLDDLSDFIVEDIGPDHFEPPVTAPVVPVARKSLFPVKTRQIRPGAVDVETIRRKLKEVRHEDYYTILEIRRGAEGPVIRQAYQRLMARFDHESLDFELAQRFYSEILEIRDAVEDAWAVLGEPELRDRYMASTSIRR